MDKLRLTPYVWQKLQYLRDIGTTEVSFFALSGPKELDLVYDVRLVPQKGYSAYTEFKDEGVADFFDQMVDEGRKPEEFARIWMHTHPGASAEPSSKDIETFKEAFSTPNWAIMFILGTTGNTTCKLKYKNHPDLRGLVGSYSHKQLEVKVDWTAHSMASDFDAWKEEYEKNVEKGTYVYTNWKGSSGDGRTLWTQSGSNSQGGSLYSPNNYQGWKQGYDWVYGHGWLPPEEAAALKAIKAEKETSPPANKLEISWPRMYDKWVQDTPASTWRPLTPSDLKRRSPIGFYQGIKDTTLTKREKKFLKKKKSLEGFTPHDSEVKLMEEYLNKKKQVCLPPPQEGDKPASPNAQDPRPANWVRPEKLEVSRGIVYEADTELELATDIASANSTVDPPSDPDESWMDEAAAAWMEEDDARAKAMDKALVANLLELAPLTEEEIKEELANLQKDLKEWEDLYRKVTTMDEMETCESAITGLEAEIEALTDMQDELLNNKLDNLQKKTGLKVHEEDKNPYNSEEYDDFGRPRSHWTHGAGYYLG